MGIIILIAVAAVIVVTLLLLVIKMLASPKKTDSIRKLLKQGKTQSAIKLAKQIIAKNPKDYKAHYYLGRAYIQDNRAELALMEFKFVNENALFGEELKEIPFRKELASMYRKFNQNEEALRELLLLTKLDPNDSDVYFQTGEILLNAGKLENAIVFFRKCVKIDKRNAKAYAEIGKILYRAKQYKDAKRELDYALSLNSENYVCHYYIGKILKDAKEYAGAVKSFEKAQRDPEYKQKALIERATCYMSANRYDNAQIDLLRAIETDKENIKNETLHARYFLALCYEKNRQIDKAIEQWEAIYRRNRAFRDVATKLTEYKELQTNDAMKDYLTASDQEFSEMCKKLILPHFNLAAQQTEIQKYGVQIFATENSKGSWREQRKPVFVVRCYRNPDPLEDTAIRDTLDKVKSLNGIKAIVCSSSSFTRSAISFAENRQIELIGKEKLEKILAANEK